MNSDTTYDKIKHLVEVEDNIFAVFTLNSKKEVNDLSIGKDIGIERKLVEDITTNFKDIFKEDNEKSITSDILGKFKWKIFEYEKIRLLFISEVDKTVVVLIKSNTTLDETVDNILGYYYEEEEEDDIPKSLF